MVDGHGFPRAVTRALSEEEQKALGPPPSSGELRYVDAGHVLGSGGFAEVRLARDPVFERDVAVKWLDATDPVARRRFETEALVMGMLDHPGVVPVYDRGTRGGRDYLAMQRVRGYDLFEILDQLAQGEALPPVPQERRRQLPWLLGVLERVAEVVAYAHARGVLHRDLKPENVMVGPFGEVFVMDWGLAQVGAPGSVVDRRETRPLPVGLFDEPPPAAAGPRCDTLPEEGGRVTHQGALLGTPLYMAPEQAAGGALDERTDVFGLGLLLYTAVGLRPRYPGNLTALVMVEKAERGARLPLPRGKALPWRVSPSLAAIIDKALEVDPDRRYPTVGALLADLRALAEDLPVSARRAGFAEQLGRVVRRRPALSLGLVLSVLFVAVTLVVAGSLDASRAQARERAAAERTAKLEALARAGRQREAALRARAAAQAEAARRRHAELQVAAARGDIDRLRTQLGVEVTNARDEAFGRWRLRLKDRRSGEDISAFIARLPRAEQLDYLRAFEALHRAHGEHPKHVPITGSDLYHLGIFRALTMGDLGGAERAYQAAIALEPDYLSPYLGRGTVRSKRKDWRGAFEDFDRYLQLARAQDRLDQPVVATAYYNRGNAYRALGQPQQALADYDEALERRPGWSAALNNRGWLLIRLRRWEEARRDFASVRVASPRSLGGMVGLGQSLIGLGRRKEGLTHLREALRKGGGPDVSLVVGTTLMELGRWAEAVTHLTTALKAGYKPTVVLRRRMEALDRSGNTRAAIDDVSELIRRTGDARLFYTRSVYHHELDDLTSARADLERLLKALPDHGRGNTNYGLLLLPLDEPARALGYFQRALRADPKLWQAHLGTARAQAKLGRTTAARAALTRARALAPSRAHAMIDRAARDLGLDEE